MAYGDDPSDLLNVFGLGSAAPAAGLGAMALPASGMVPVPPMSASMLDLAGAPSMAGGTQIASANPTEDEMRAYAKAAAIKRGIDPNIVQTVISGEGGWKNPYQHGVGPAPKSQDPSLGKLENSYGPLQLYISGHGDGLGDAALAAGIDPRKDWKGGLDYALDYVAQHGWDDWYGAKKAGITGMMGVHGNAAPVGHQAAISQASQAGQPNTTPQATANATTPASTPASDAGDMQKMLRLMYMASLMNVKLQPVDYNPYAVMPHFTG